MTLSTRPLLRLLVDVGVPLSFGECGAGERRCVPILGGAFEGELRGQILPGADWQNVRADGAIEIAAHYALRTEAGALLEVDSRGLRCAPPEVAAALMRGEKIDPGLYYFRTHMRFHTSAPELKRFANLLAVATGAREQNRVALDVFEIL